ncbi:MAG: hypothetical protein OEO79_17800 [Gemmatimonadota bacterium]|nr:hypothetical protein [Gemmatimonadota bacterium]
MRLTAKDHPEGIKRYAHVRPSRGWKATACSSRWPGTSYLCTREKGHRGPHAAHGWFRKVLAVWEPEAGGESSSGAAGMPAAVKSGRGPPARRPIGLRSRSPVGLLERLRSILVRGVSSLEEIVFLVFFLAFVAFAIGGFLLIYLG